MEGKGKLYYQSGKLAYDGEWQKDQFSGFGILYNECPHACDTVLSCENFEDIEEFWTKFEGSCIVYLGHFSEDAKEGKGTLYFSNGDYFVGMFQKDAITGQGVFYSHNGKMYKGEWANNRLLRTSS